MRKYLTLLNLYPRIKALHAYIEKKSAQGKLPPSIDRDQIMKLIEHPEMPCPLCGTHLTKEARMQLQSLLNQYELSSRVANLLSSFRSPLEELITEAESYETAREELLQKEQSLQNRIKEAEVQLEEKTAPFPVMAAMWVERNLQRWIRNFIICDRSSMSTTAR